MHCHSDSPCWNCSKRLKRSRLVPVAEAAQLCEVPPKLVRQWMQDGDVEWLQLPTGAPLLLSDTLPTGEKPPPVIRKNVTQASLPVKEAPQGADSRTRIRTTGRDACVTSPRCFVCGRPAKEERRLLSVYQVKRLCRVQNYTLTRWICDGLVEFVSSPRGRLFYLDSLFQEPRRHRDLEVRGISRKGAKPQSPQRAPLRSS